MYSAAANAVLLVWVVSTPALGDAGVLPDPLGWSRLPSPSPPLLRSSPAGPLTQASSLTPLRLSPPPK